MSIKDARVIAPAETTIFGKRMHKLDDQTWLITRVELDHYGAYVFEEPDFTRTLMRSMGSQGIGIDAWIKDDVLYVKELR